MREEIIASCIPEKLLERSIEILISLVFDDTLAEDQPRPVFPSSFFLLAPGDGSLGLAVRCPACQKTSVNLVSHQHVDLPFHNDPEVGVVEHVFSDDVARTLEEFRAELYSASFDTRRLGL